MNVLVMQALEQRGHIDQLITHFMISYDRSTEQHGGKEVRDRQLGIPSVGSEAHIITTYCVNDNDYKDFIRSIKYDKHSIQSLLPVR